MSLYSLDITALVEAADHIDDELTAKEFEAIREVIDDADVAIGLFRDADAMQEVNWHVIKGHRLLTTIIADQHARLARVIFIFCRDIGEAIAMQRATGGPRALN